MKQQAWKCMHVKHSEWALLITSPCLNKDTFNTLAAGIQWCDSYFTMQYADYMFVCICLHIYSTYIRKLQRNYSLSKNTQEVNERHLQDSEGHYHRLTHQLSFEDHCCSCCSSDLWELHWLSWKRILFQLCNKPLFFYVSDRKWGFPGQDVWHHSTSLLQTRHCCAGVGTVSAALSQGRGWYPNRLSLLYMHSFEQA